MSENAPPSAKSILLSASKHLEDRAQTYDKPHGERSMPNTVAAFKAITGIELSVEQGHLFMVCLKAVRSQQGKLRMDSYEDGAAYFGLAGEAAHGERSVDDRAATENPAFIVRDLCQRAGAEIDNESWQRLTDNLNSCFQKPPVSVTKHHHDDNIGLKPDINSILAQVDASEEARKPGGESAIKAVQALRDYCSENRIGWDETDDRRYRIFRHPTKQNCTLMLHISEFLNHYKVLEFVREWFDASGMDEPAAELPKEIVDYPSNTTLAKRRIIFHGDDRPRVPEDRKPIHIGYFDDRWTIVRKVEQFELYDCYRDLLVPRSCFGLFKTNLTGGDVAVEFRGEWSDEDTAIALSTLSEFKPQ